MILNEYTVLVCIFTISAMLALYVSYVSYVSWKSQSFTNFHSPESFLPEGGTDDNLLYVPKDKTMSIEYPKEQKQLELLRLLGPVDERLVNTSVLFQEPRKDTVSCPSTMKVIDSKMSTKHCNKNCSSPQDISPTLWFDSLRTKSKTHTCQKNETMPFLLPPANSCDTLNLSSDIMKMISLDSDSKNDKSTDFQLAVLSSRNKISPNDNLPSPTQSAASYYTPFLSM